MEKITKEQVLKTLERVVDPELRINIVDLGLIYDVEITENNDVGVDMTLTTQGCPAGPLLQMQTEAALKSIPGVGEVHVRMVFDPPWTPDRMSERLKKARSMGLI